MSAKTADTNQTHESVHPRHAAKPATKEQVAPTPQSNLETSQRAGANLQRAQPADVLALQHLVGNRAIQRLIQTKLTVGPAGDQYEQEADRVAQQVMNLPDGHQQQASGDQSPVQRVAEEEDELQTKPLATSITPLVQRAPEEEEDLQMKPLAERVQRVAEDEEEIQTKPLLQRQTEDEDELQAKPSVQRRGEDGFEVGGDFEQQLAASRGSGSPLPVEVRSFMEPRFGADFSGVRIHTGSEAAQLNREVSAQAFTHGSDIYLGAGQSDLESAQGKQLLAHELTHVVQQTETPKSVQRHKGAKGKGDTSKKGKGSTGKTEPTVEGWRTATNEAGFTLSESDWKKTGAQIWDQCTPDKDRGALFLGLLETLSGTEGIINTATLKTAGPFKKVSEFLEEYCKAPDAKLFPPSTLWHANGEGRYPGDEGKGQGDYVELGFSGTEQTRFVVAVRDAKKEVWISTHYENPKQLRVDGNLPTAVIDCARKKVMEYYGMEAWDETNLDDQLSSGGSTEGEANKK